MVGFFRQKDTMMKRFFLSVAVLCVFSLLCGCGGEKPRSQADQKKALEQTQANMAKGMEAMKALKGPQAPRK
jgi:hypothetical protein